MGSSTPGRGPAIIVDTPPTPNGDLHLGHLAGPFMAGDVHARYLRARGRPVVFSTGTDDSQTHVLATARRRNSTPQALAAKSRLEIGRTLQQAAIAVDGYALYDERYRSTVHTFISELHAKGKFRLRTVSFPYSERTGEFCVEGLVAGHCPVCITRSGGGVCEMCGHPNNYDELIEPWSTVDPDDPLTTREATILVLPMEEYREQLTAYYSARESLLRPRTMQFIREALAGPLPDFPITYPLSYGLPSPFAETEGQVLNAWVEGIPAVMYCTAYAAEQAGLAEPASDDLWLAENDPQIIYFIGSDNVYFWGLTHLALLMAHEGRYALPDMIITNEFYELENEKFSTSRGHVVYIDDALSQVSLDALRFYLCLTGPEYQQTSFTRDALVKVTEQRLVRPWNRLANALNAAAADQRDGDRPGGAPGGSGGADPGRELPVSAEARAKARAVLDRFVGHYEIGGYSPARAAEVIVVQLDRLHRAAERLDRLPADQRPQAIGDLFLEVRALVAGASPILIDLAERVRAAGGWDGTVEPAALDVPAVTSFLVPALSGAGQQHA